MINRRELLAVLGAAPLALKFGVSGALAQDQDVDQVVIAIGGDIKNYNIDIIQTLAWFPSTLYFERLTAMDYGPDFKIRPLLAKSWTVSDDGLVYTFHLNDGVTWHDGTPFISHDVKYTFEAVVAQNTYAAPALKAVKSIDLPDDLTAVVTLKAPSASFLASISTYPRTAILPAHLYEGKPWDNHPNNLNPVGTGAFKFETAQQGEFISFVRNDAYWGDKPHIKRIVYRVVPDADVQVALLQSGEVQALDYPPALAMEPVLRGSPGVTVNSAPGPMVFYLGFNNTKAPFDNVDVRRAMSYALDRKVLAERASNNSCKPALGTYVSSLWAFDPNIKLPDLDVAKAGQMLDAAGFPVKDGQRFSFDLWVSRPTESLAAQIVREQLRALNVDVHISQLDETVMRPTLPKLEHGAYIYGSWWGPDPNEWSPYCVTGGYLNYMGYSNPKVDQLFADGDRAQTMDDRKAVYSKIQQIMLDEMPCLPMFDCGPFSFAHRTELTGWFSQPDPEVSFRCDMRRVRRA